MKQTGLAAFSICVLALAAFAQSDYERPRTSHFSHIVVIIQENRTPDNLFYALCSTHPCSTHPTDAQYNIQSDAWANSRSGHTTPRAVPLAGTYDLGHYHKDFDHMCDLDPVTRECKMDGAIEITCSGAKANPCPPQPQYRYVDNSDGSIQPYLDLATQYGWANYMFQTNQGPSFPAHQVLFGGTSAPTAADDATGIFASENMSNSEIAGLSAIAGCIAPSSTRVQLIDAAGIEAADEQVYPCFEHKTLPDVLSADQKVTWRYYAPSAGSIWTAPDAIEHICQSTGFGGSCEGDQFRENVDLKPADVLTDIGNCQLRELSWVIPTGANSDHAKANDGGGPSWVASIVNAIGKSTCAGGYWKDTAILVAWDDWGGWYDHVPPRFLPYPQGGYQLGFRVPFLFISAYTPNHYVDNTPHDFGSILRFIEGNFGIEEGVLGFADERANDDLAGFFDEHQRPRKFKTIPARFGASHFIKDKRPPTDPDDD